LRALLAARAFVLALLLCWASSAVAEVAVPPLTGRVVDLTGTLSGDFVDQQSRRLKDLERRKGSQVAVLIVPTTQPETIEQYSIRVADAWKIGRRKIDDGALLVVAKNDHKLRIEVGYGLEGALTDVTARRIIDEVIVPRFKSGDFDGGVGAGLTYIISVIEGEPLPIPQPEASHETDPGWVAFVFSPFGLLIYAAIAAMMRSLLGRLIGSTAAAGVVTALAWYVGGSIAVAAIIGVAAFFLTLFGDSIIAASQEASRNAARGRRRGGDGGWSTGWSGGSGGGWSSGSSSSDSDSGFSGGGGSFGGGGASGSW
jgi:uncharacterized protein